MIPGMVAASASGHGFLLPGLPCRLARPRPQAGHGGGSQADGMRDRAGSAGPVARAIGRTLLVAGGVERCGGTECAACDLVEPRPESAQVIELRRSRLTRVVKSPGLDETDQRVVAR